jgi:hypothetical protein
MQAFYHWVIAAFCIARRCKRMLLFPHAKNNTKEHEIKAMGEKCPAICAPCF